MRIRRPYGLSSFGIGLAVSFGILSGIYIWKPILARLTQNHKVGEEKKDSSNTTN